ncbi:hypothetical protein MLD38_021976 [Melastoma candidum]|uniref:Uncharacterized protein n=1 Tax=Melastoma candidum TaxID=119954 RepID=A0ACB9QQW5_9MYRT|nr:hypothetical protein MLD38_021976 [Melastoma candidum]
MVSKMAWKKAHKTLALVVCQVLGWDFERLPVIERKGQPLSQSLSVPLGAVGDDNGAESGKSPGKENQVNRHGSFKAFLDTDIGSAIGEATEVAADSTGDANRNLTDSTEDAMQMHKDKDDVSMDKTCCDDSRVKTNDEVVNDAINSGNNTSSGSAEKSTEYCQAHVEIRITEDAGSYPLAVARQDTAPEVLKPAELSSDENQAGNVRLGDNNCEETKEEEEHMDAEKGSEVFHFFMKLFMENANLKNYYEGNSRDGEFCCLVCGVEDEKTWKRFRGCQGLIQHTAMVLKTRQKEHRAYERALKECLGWLDL